MTNVTIPGLSTQLTSVDRAADLLEVSDTSDSGNSKKSSVNNLLDLTSHPVGVDDTQTLTSKTLTSPTITTPTITVYDSAFTVQDNSDPTKQAQLQASGITAGQTRTYTLPDGSTTLVGTGLTQTLTNKTLTAPTITNPTVTVDTISEFTAANGVTIDGLNIKDSKLNTNNSVVTNNITNDAVTPPKWSNPYKFYVTRTAALNSSGTSFAALPFDTELFDTNNNHSAGTYTVPVNGFYQFNWGAHVNTGASGRTVIAALYVGGSEISRGSRAISSGSNLLGSTGSCFIQLTAGNTVTVSVYTDSTQAFDVGASFYNFLSGFLVEET